MNSKKLCHKGIEEFHYCNDMSDCRYGFVDKNGLTENECYCFFSADNTGRRSIYTLTIPEYMSKAREICKVELMSRTAFARELNIAYQTLVSLEQNPELCSMKTLKKLKMFVENWESKK